MRIVAKTDKGKIRKDNQDSYAAGELPGGVTWAVVCDGMGGAAGGSVASSIAVKMISEKITASYQHGMSDNSIKHMLISVIETANASIYEMSQSIESLNGMGTTVVAAIVRDNMLYLAHAGDSRAYRISDDGIRQLTRDHSVVQDMVEQGKLTQEQAKEYPGKNIITRALGVGDYIDVDFSQEELDVKDVIVICTDGLTNYVETDDIYNATRNDHYYEIADRLVNLANENGGGDNITVVAIAF
ncbi:MAG: Stp1/IreP family PP2C-type Ser/Thr phosphatase [Oscillospiraceae bacterium]|nr:Stp1/IreP family PP2C-type Ser/Thr phosphatase [Oscillospiraceae bacterium]